MRPLHFEACIMLASWLCLPCRHRAALAAQQEEQRREQLAGRLAAKEAKVAAMEAEKAAMAHALEAVRKEITMQEHQLR